MKIVIVSAAYWSAVLLAAAKIFFASNLAGPSGTPTYFLPAANVIAVGAVVYVVGLIQFRPRKRH